MKRVLIVLSLVTVMLFATQAMSADREAIKNNVDEVVNAIDGGKDAKSYAADAFAPYVFIMQADGKLLVHPKLAGQDLKEKAMPIYQALQPATPVGAWVKYEWDGKEKNTYAKKTKSNLTVASGY